MIDVVAKRPMVLAGVAAVAVALLAGVVALGSPLVALGLVVGPVLLAVLILRPWVAVAVLVSAEAANIPSVVEHGGGLILYLLTVVAGCSVLVGLRRGTIRLAWSPVFLFAALYLASRAVSLLVASDVQAGTAAVSETAKQFVYLIVVTTVLSSSDRQPGIGRVLVSVVAVLAGLSIVQEFVFHNSTTFWGLSQVPFTVDIGGTTARHAGPYQAADVVGWGKVQAMFLPIAVSMWAGRSAGRWRWLWCGVTLTILGGIYLTQSRGAYIAVMFAVVVWLVVAGRAYRRLLLFAPVVLLVIALIPGVGSRLATLGTLGEATRGGGGDASLVERAALQRDALTMIDAHPSLGVGPGNFLVVHAQFQLGSGPVMAGNIPVHNSYLEVAAEGGLLGLVAWLLFYGCAVFVAVRALIYFRRRSPGQPPGPGGWLAVGVIGGLAGFALATLFVPLTQVRTLLSVVALGAALDVRARRTAEAAPIAPVAPARERPAGFPRWSTLVRRPAVVGPAVFAVAVAVGVLVLPLRGAPVWLASATVQVVPRLQDRSAANAYEYDLLSRGTLAPTYALLITDRLAGGGAPRGDPPGSPSAPTRVSVDNSPTAALITVSATNADRATAERTVRDVLDKGRSDIAALDDWYVFAPVPSVNTVAEHDGPLRPWRVGALLAASAVLAGAASWNAHRRRRRGSG
jgi:O-antigen ligase